MPTIDIDSAPVESWEIDKVIPYPHNHKIHTEKQIDNLARSIRVQGHLDPIAIDENGVIISGHGRLAALKKLGKTYVSVRVLRGLTDDQASALRIAANKTVSNEYDTDMLARELAKLNDGEFDLTILGMEQRELDMLITDVGEIDAGSLVEDLEGAIDSHEADVDERAAAADGDAIRLDKAFGFKTIPLPAQRVVTQFMAAIEDATGLVGPDALVKHMREVAGV